MIKMIIFDNNGVLTSCDADFTIPRFAEYFGMNVEDLRGPYNRLVEPADLGNITTQDFFCNLCNEIGKTYDPDKMWDVFKECYQPKDGMRQTLFDLRGRYKIALLTNFIDTYDYFNENTWHYNDVFDSDKMFVSSKLHMAKPNDDIYLHALDKLGVSPEEFIYVDDRSLNVSAAEKLGMKGLLFTSVEQFKSDLGRKE
jgi:putative hydrolase of the HAD superfamily